MALTKIGALKIAAKKIGIAFDEYISNVKIGLKWCSGHKEWHHYSEFGFNKLKSDGLAPSCLDFNREYHKKRYQPKPRFSKRGFRFVDPRDGDKKQARARINHLVEIGLLPNPNTLKCSKCNNRKKAKRNEYHHHKGYSAEFQEDVIVVCSVCHSFEKLEIENESNEN